jgi:hypothetical protein
MKKVACFAIDEKLLVALEKDTSRVVDGQVFRRSKSEIVNEVLKKYFARR